MIQKHRRSDCDGNLPLTAATCFGFLSMIVFSCNFNSTGVDGTSEEQISGMKESCPSHK